jgi:hypothetical protein
MAFVCRRCYRITKHKPFRVTKEDAGVVLLNLLVCPSCARLAKSLGLSTVKTAKNADETKGVQAMIDGRQRPTQYPPSIR